MVKPLKVNAFITVYKTRIKHQREFSADDVINIVAELVNPIDYISYDDKLKIIDQTLQETNDKDYPSAQRHRLFLVNLISAYTNLECRIKDFDLLCESGLLDVIISLFEKEYKICNSLMQMCLYDQERKT